MFSTSFKPHSCALVLLVSIVGLAIATFEGRSSCGIQTHRASGLVLWCEFHSSSFNETIFVAPLDAINNRVAIYSYKSSPFGTYHTIATPYLETSSGQIIIVVSNFTSGTSTLRILSGSIQDLNSWTTVHTEPLTAEVNVQTWVNGVFLFSTLLDGTVKNISYKALVPNNNGFSFVEIFSYSTIVQSNVRAWTMDGSARLCLSLLVALESSIVCRSLTNPSADLVIYSATNTSPFAPLVSNNNGRIFWAEIRPSNTSLGIWAANSDKTDTPAVLNRTTDTILFTLSYASALQLGYDSYNKLVYWTENIAIADQSTFQQYGFGVFGWDGKTNAVVTYYIDGKSATTVGQLCTYDGQMMLTSTDTSLYSYPNLYRYLYSTSPSAGKPSSVEVFSHNFQTYSGLSLACDTKTGWAALSFSDVNALIGSSVSAIRMDNTTSLPVQFSADVNMTLGTVTLTDGVIGYTLGNTELLVYDLFFYTLPIDDVSGVDNNSPTGRVSFANQLAPLTYFVFGLSALLVQ